MFGGGSNSNASSAKTDNDSETDATALSSTTEAGSASTKSSEQAAGEKRSGNGSPPGGPNIGGIAEKKRRSSSVGSKASSLLASARNSLSFSPGRTNSEMGAQSPLQKLGKQDPALAVPQGQHNNSAGESAPGPNSTFRVGVWEDRNKKCRRTMEDTHSFLYNFLDAPAPQSHVDDKSDESESDGASHHSIVETDNGYFAIFDGHAGTFAADWCGKKVHIILEDLVRKYPNVALPQLLDQTFTTVDNLLEKLPLKNSGCTAAIAVLRWEARSSTERSATATAINMPQKTKNTEPKDSSAVDAVQDGVSTNSQVVDGPTNDIVPSPTSSKQRVLYTANVGDARIILCRNGKALRLSYDHKGSDENEGKRIANAGGLILNNRVNGVLAVTRALGDTYLKNLVTGHPYTTETVIQPEVDEFIIIACDGLWDVCSDQEAVDLVRGVQDPTEASKLLVEHALGRFSTDNLSCMIVRLNREAAVQSLQKDDEIVFRPNRASEADRIVMDTKQRIAEGLTPAVGISATNSGRGYDAPEAQDGDFVPTALDGTVEEEPNVLGELEIPEPKRDVVSTTEKLATPNKTERP